MSCRPQTLYALTNSPVGLAAWMLDHDVRSQEMIARVFAGGSEGLSRDDVLDNITLYWLTNTAISSARLYWDTTQLRARVRSSAHSPPKTLDTLIHWCLDELLADQLTDFKYALARATRRSIFRETLPMKTYLINHLRIPGDVPNGNGLTYLENVEATVARFGGRWLAQGAPDIMEGSWPGSGVLMEFPSRESASSWYNSTEYQAILPLRTRTSISDLVFIDALPPEFTVKAFATDVRRAIQKN